jgi:pyruvate formate lyase activating enzyme
MVTQKESLGAILDRLSMPGELYEVVDKAEGKIRCVACAHRCLIKEGRRGICQVRFNRSGTLYVPHNYVAALNVDPIEKKPFYHMLPGTDALSFGMLGCDFHCDFCQNWLTSQALRDDAAGIAPQPITARELVQMGLARGAASVASTYNEPLITSEWAVEVFKLAREAGMHTLYVSNGNGTPEALDYLAPHLDGYKIDLKTMRDATYRRIIGGVLQHVLDTIQNAYDRGFWVEIVTLIIPGMNDDEAELRDAAEFIHSVSPDIPWHVTGFYPTYKMTDPGSTPARTLLRAAEIGKEAGLNYVYAGNRPGQTEGWENTKCPSCGETLIWRWGFHVRRNVITPEGTCPHCATPIAGIWG